METILVGEAEVTCGVPEKDHLHCEETSMVADGESQLQATSQRGVLAAPYAILTIGSFNVRMWKNRNVSEDVERYSVNILDISEVIWTGSGRLRTTIGEFIFGILLFCIQTLRGGAPCFVTAHAFSASRDGPRNSGLLRTVPTSKQYRYFCAVYEYVGKGDLSK